MASQQQTQTAWQRQDWMGLLATAAAAPLALHAEPFIDGLAHEQLRAPEIGTVMTRGRIGGTGGPFNLGEMTITRCSVRLSCGTVGHAYVQGRDKSKARNAALVDALMQTEQAGSVTTAVLAPLAQARSDSRQARAEKAAATKVDFFTLVRGED